MFCPNILHRQHVKFNLKYTLCPLKQQLRPSHDFTNRDQTHPGDSPALGSFHAIEKGHVQHEVRLEPIQRLRHTAYEQSWLQKNTKRFDNPLQSYEDGQRLLSTEWIFPLRKQARNKRPTPAGFNAITARLRKLGLDLRPVNILYGMTNAYEDPAAMKQYLLMLPRPPAHDLLAVRLHGQALYYIVQRIRKPPTNQRDLDQWFNVITGLRDNGSFQSNQPQEFSLFDLGPGLDMLYWGLYVKLLNSIFGPEIVYQEYLRFKNQNPAHGTLEGGDQQFLEWVINPTILRLAQGNDPERAWRLAREVENPSKGILAAPLKALLAYPDYVRTYIPKMFPTVSSSALEVAKDNAMTRSVSTELEKNVRRLENELGLRWRGGADGYHTTNHGKILFGFHSEFID